MLFSLVACTGISPLANIPALAAGVATKEKAGHLSCFFVREFAPSDKLPTGKDGAMFRTHILKIEDFQSGSIPTESQQKQKALLVECLLFLLVSQLGAKSNFINENTVLKSTVQHCGWNYDYSTLPHKIINLAAGITICSTLSASLLYHKRGIMSRFF